jgi:hypothetical protein
MKMKKFNDFERYGEVDYINSTEELVKFLNLLVWNECWKAVRVEFFDTTKKDLVVSRPFSSDIFETLGEFSPEEIQFITFYSKDYNFVLTNLDFAWIFNSHLSTIEEDFHIDKTLHSTSYGKNQIL